MLAFPCCRLFALCKDSLVVKEEFRFSVEYWSSALLGSLDFSEIHEVNTGVSRCDCAIQSDTMSLLLGLTTNVPATVLELGVTCKYCLMIHEFLSSFTGRMQ